MNVVVDTSVWSLVLRRQAPGDGVMERALTQLIEEGRVLMLGPIRQELLCGVRTAQHFKSLRESLRAFPDVSLLPDDYEAAAACFNRCRAKGIQGSNTDFLICAVALRCEAAILTTDEDFKAFEKILRIQLLRPR